MRGKLFFGAATAALLMFTASASAQQSDPAGDASTTARLDGAASGELSPAGDKDWYRLRVEQGQRYSFALDGVPDAEGAAVDPMIGIYDAEGNQLAFNDDANGTLNAALQWSPSESGDVFVEVGAFMDTGMGPYRLAVSSGPAPTDDVGNDVSTRARIQAGRPVTGNIEYEGDGDFYRLSARTSQRYSITLSNAGGDGGLADPFLRVVDGEGNELASNDDADDLNSALEFVPTQNGDVFVEARGFADANTGAYTLSVSTERAPSDNTSGDRNTRGRINAGGNVEGDLSFPADQDWYRIRLQEGQSYRFTLNSAGANPLSDPLLHVYNSAGEEVGVDDDGGEGFNSYLEFTAPSTGNYFLGASAFGEASTGGYALGVREGDIPADNTTDASLTPDGDYREGVLSPAGDRDWYRLNLAEGQGLRVGLAGTGTPDTLGDPLLVLYGPDGAEILRDDDGGDALNAWFEYSATQAGTHYLEVRGFTEDAAGRYAVSITGGEIGGSAEMAEYIAPNGEGRVSTIGTPDDTDWYSVELIEGRPYRFYADGMDPDPLADPLLTIYDSQGAQVAVDDDGGSGVNSYLGFTSPTGGSYFAGVSSFNSSGAGRYQLRVIDTDVPGHAYTDEMLDAAGDDRIGNIEISGDIDAYRVELEAGVRYVIEVNGHGDDPLGDAFLTIADGEGTRVTSDDDSGSGMDARLQFTPENAGTFLIQASGLGGSTGWYQVSIMRQ
ncbi:PPC domain-containing protein [Terricaulis silvestris]|uniref:Peptidase C-terminal archaeal/bacterial domain-containing protein n=1 Tax=Terricaulis silvestris TaxID=2686094 RepID=A0A6I6MZB9_9CAUL|nr:PPC domain-containing protein [Terricaulis silvestris]QGZ96992.1 hypothetical protein DSM104635_03857 [Terricaulis silvestris]